jgi:hypothetical protein
MSGRVEVVAPANEYFTTDSQPKGKAAAPIPFGSSFWAKRTPAIVAPADEAKVAQAARLEKLAAKAPAAEEEVDLWGDEPLGDEYTAEEQANQDRLDAIAAAHKAKKAAAGKLKQVIGKSKIVLDVKPWDDETDLAAMEKACRGELAFPVYTPSIRAIYP